MVRPQKLVWLPLALLLASGGCGKVQELLGLSGGDDEVPVAPDPAPGATAPSAEKACGGTSYPCTWNEVSDEVLDRMGDVALQALRSYEGGMSAEKIASKLGESDDVLVLGYSDDSVHYRVTGGRPASVLLATAASPPTLGGAIVLPPRLPTVGPWLETTDKTPRGTQPKKKALVLSPFLWQWQLPSEDVDGGSSPTDEESADVAEYLGKAEDYEGGVDVEVSPLDGTRIAHGVGLEDFASWSDYAAVHVSTHGTTCKQPLHQDCLTSLATGEVWSRASGREPAVGSLLDRALSDEELSAGIHLGYIPIIGSKATVARVFEGVYIKERDGSNVGSAALDQSKTYLAGPFVLVNSKFFTATYPDKLEKTIVFLSACESGTRSDLIDALKGPNTAVLGWNKVVDPANAAAAARIFWLEMVGTGDDGEDERAARVKEAFDELKDTSAEAAGAARLEFGETKSIALGGIAVEEAVTGAELQSAGDQNLRAREIIRLLTKGGRRRLDDGGLVTLAGGGLGDGANDKLHLHAEVFGIAEDDNPRDYVIHVDVDGREARTTFTPTEKVGSGVWRGEAEIDVGFDIPGPTFVLEPWVELPKGGTSRWRYEDIGVQYFTFTLSGPAFGSPQTFSIPPDKLGVQVFETSMLLSYTDRKERNVMSEDGSYLNHMYWGISPKPEVNLGGGTFELGHEDYGWGSRVTLQGRGCPPSGQGCKHITIRTDSGSVKITKFVLGEHPTRPDVEGATYVSAEFEGTFIVRPMHLEGATINVEGSFAVVD